MTLSNSYDSNKDILERKSILFLKVLNFRNKSLFYVDQPAIRLYASGPAKAKCSTVFVIINVCLKGLSEREVGL